VQVEYTRNSAATSTSPAKIGIITFKEFADLAKRRHWSAQDLAARFRGRIDSPLEFFTRVLSGKSPDAAIPYRSVIDLFTSSQIAEASRSSRPVCSCGCGQVVFDRKKWATPGCRTKAHRGKVRQEQFWLGQMVDFVKPRLRQNRRMATLPLTERRSALQRD